MPRPAVFLTRDGVINRFSRHHEFGTPVAPAHPSEFELIPGVGEAIASLNRLRIPTIAVSNQPGIAEGKLTPVLLDAITEKMRATLAVSGARLDGVLYCRHNPDGVVDPYAKDCECRKPKPGLLFRAGRERNLSLPDSFMVGADPDDVAAGQAAGVTTFLISPHRCATCADFSSQDTHPDCIAKNLTEAFHAITQFLAASGKLPNLAAVPPPR
jgi:D-glycero-D-manno-heptose 1,7-bisphosphate phosphatase